MPLTPSSFSTSSFFRSSSLGSDSFPLSSSSSFSALPPPLPGPRRYTPIRRGFTDSQMMFHTRPLRNLTVVSRSPSPVSSSSRSSVPRRIFPQVGTRSEVEELNGKEDSPVVFDANLTFVLGCKGKLRQNVRPVPAHLEAQTASNVLTNKIEKFLKKTDHVMDEWKRLGKRDDGVYERRLREGRSRSATNILIKGFQLYSRSSSCSRSSVARDYSLEDCTEAEADEV